MKIPQKISLARLLSVAILVFILTAANGQTPKLTLDLAKPGLPVSPMLYGLMTEEINHSYDGGLYAELIQNRIFQDNPAAFATGGRGRRGGAATQQTEAAPPAPAPNFLSHWSVVNAPGARGTIALDTNDPVNT